MFVPAAASPEGKRGQAPCSRFRRSFRAACTTSIRFRARAAVSISVGVSVVSATPIAQVSGAAGWRVVEVSSACSKRRAHAVALRASVACSSTENSSGPRCG
jgi:hypothetical protein